MSKREIELTLMEQKTKKEHLDELAVKISRVLRREDESATFNRAELSLILRRTKRVKSAMKEKAPGNDVTKYGRTLSAPNRFWQSPEGIMEIKRRIAEFKEEEGRLPNVTDLKMSLGLATFYDSYIKEKSKYLRVLAKMGYSEQDIGQINYGVHLRPESWRTSAKFEAFMALL